MKISKKPRIAAVVLAAAIAISGVGAAQSASAATSHTVVHTASVSAKKAAAKKRLNAAIAADSKAYSLYKSRGAAALKTYNAVLKAADSWTKKQEALVYADYNAAQSASKATKAAKKAKEAKDYAYENKEQLVWNKRINTAFAAYQKVVHADIAMLKKADNAKAAAETAYDKIP
jgi:hypothetical protein